MASTRTRHRRRLVRTGLALAAACFVPLLPGGPAGAQTSHAGTNGWIKDSTKALNIFLPDADSIYYFDGYGTASGAQTVISGQAPHARYWSFTAYPLASAAPWQHVHDTEVPEADGRYRIVLATSCAGIGGTCLNMGPRGGLGIVVMRLYVPADLNGAGTGKVPLPSIWYRNSRGSLISLAQASGSVALSNAMASYRAMNGALPSSLTATYPAPAPVPVPDNSPPPEGRVSHQAEGAYANPDNVYEHIALSTARGDLVVKAQAPTYETDAFPKANNLARTATQDPQVRYWSLCVVLTNRHTGNCLRDEQVHLDPGSHNFSVVVAPACPVAGYKNCLVAGPQPLQSALSERNLLPSRQFAARALSGTYELRATYVTRP